MISKVNSYRIEKLLIVDVKVEIDFFCYFVVLLHDVRGNK